MKFGEWPAQMQNEIEGEERRGEERTEREIPQQWKRKKVTGRQISIHFSLGYSGCKCCVSFGYKSSCAKTDKSRSQNEGINVLRREITSACKVIIDDKNQEMLMCLLSSQSFFLVISLWDGWPSFPHIFHLLSGIISLLSACRNYWESRNEITGQQDFINNFLTTFLISLKVFIIKWLNSPISIQQVLVAKQLIMSPCHKNVWAEAGGAKEGSHLHL